MTSQYLLDTLTPVMVYTFFPSIGNSNVHMVLDMSTCSAHPSSLSPSRSKVMAEEGHYVTRWIQIGNVHEGGCLHPAA